LNGESPSEETIWTTPHPHGSDAWKKGSFDLSVIYLAGLDHYVHAYGVDAGRAYFQQHLHQMINRVVNELSARNLLDSTVFAVFADHGSVNTDPDKSIDLRAVGPKANTLKIKPALDVLGTPDGHLTVGGQYAEGGVLGAFARHPNVIFVPNSRSPTSTSRGTRPTDAKLPEPIGA
jgi:hypothetical protein